MLHRSGGRVSLSSGAEKARIAAAAAAVVILAAVFLQVGYAYTAMTQNTNNTVTSEYVVLSQTNYRFSNNAVFATDEITAQYSDFTSTVTSENGADDTVVCITVADRSTIAAYEIVKFRVMSTIQGVKHTAAFILSITSTDDSGKTITAADEEIVEGSIGAGSEDPGEYVFYLEVTGMKSQPSVKTGAAVTQYVMNGTGPITAISGTSYAGKAIGTDTLKADHTTSTADLNVAVTSSGFTDLGSSGWMYILALTREGETTQYAYSTNGSTWSYVSGSPWTLLENKEYTTTLYLAGHEAGTGTNAYAWEDVPRTNGAVITAGTVTFTHTTS